MAGTRQIQLIGFAAFTLFLWSVPVSSWMADSVGTECIPNGPCLVPVGLGLKAPSGVLAVGVTLVVRDVVQRCLGVAPSFIAILGGAMLLVAIAVQSLVVALVFAFLLGELADLFVFTSMERRGLMRAVVASSLVGAVVDSSVFAYMAFSSLDYLPGLVIGKIWGVLLGLPFVQLLRRFLPAAAG